MTGQRLALRAALVITAVLVQVVIVNKWSLPGGHPDLLVLVVVGFALVTDPQRGALLGFFAGLFADLVPPAGHIAGRLAFAYTVVGYLAGMFGDGEDNSVSTTIMVVAGGSAAVVLLYAGVGGLVGDARISLGVTARSVLATVVYDVILAPFVVPLVTRLARRLEPAGPR
ncbi:MAG TPA: rod shape-determining protein MreD [Mycobacteriales bacterium]|nr:rod shape-determining protein MreD [Mycobacteriales bacterium]